MESLLPFLPSICIHRKVSYSLFNYSISQSLHCILLKAVGPILWEYQGIWNYLQITVILITLKILYPSNFSFPILLTSISVTL